MTLKRSLFGATALCGSLILFAAPARAECTTQPVQNAGDQVTCTGEVQTPVVLPANVSTLVNQGTIATPGQNAVDGRQPGQLLVSNSGTITGAIDLQSAATRTLYNGFDPSGVRTAGTARISGDISFGDGDDFLRNAGEITGTIRLGDGVNGLINEAGGVINGDIFGGDIENNVVIAGTLNGDADMGFGVTYFELSGTLNGTVTLGGEDDTVVINGRPTITGENKIDTGGGAGDTVIFRGDNGTWESFRTTAERMIKDGGGVTILTSGGSTYNGGITVREGRLIFGETPQADEIVGNAIVEHGGIYEINGNHFGTILVENGGVLTGSGRISDQRYPEHDVTNGGIVAPGRNGLGTLTITSDYTQLAGGQLDIELGAPGQSDLLAVGGVATLGGTVNFIPLNLADTGAYTFMTYGSRQGQFGTVTTSGLFFTSTVQYLGDRAVVNVVKTGTPPPPPPPTGCSPANPAPGTTVICTPPITGSFDFTASDIIVSVQGMLDVATDGAIIATFGDETTVQVAAGAGIVNSQEGQGALFMAGDVIELANGGVIDATNATPSNAEGAAIITFAVEESGQGTIVNAAGARIGHQGVADGVVAIRGNGPGETFVENDGAIYGDIDLRGARIAVIDNGFTSGSTQTSGPRLIRGDIRLGGGDDTIRNSGTISGTIFTGAGADTILNFPDAVIDGDLATGEGDDLFEQQGDGALTGYLDMSTGTDVADLSGSIGGLQLGDGDDTLRIRGLLSVGDNQILEGADGSDTLIFFGNNGSWDVSRFATFEGLVKEGGGTTTITGIWSDTAALGNQIENGRLEIAAASELHGSTSVEARGELFVNGALRGAVEIEDSGILAGTGSVGTAADFAAGTRYAVTNYGTLAPGAIVAGSEIGTLNIYGDLFHRAGGVMEIELGAPGLNDIVRVHGATTLTGDVQFIPRDASALGAYTFLYSNGGVSGQFGTVNPDQQASQGLMFTYVVDYSQANQVSVNVTKTATTPTPPTPTPTPPTPPTPTPPTPTPTPTPPTPPSIEDVIGSLNPNEREVLDAFLSDGVFTSDLALVRSTLDGIDLTKAAQALGSFSGEIYGVTPAIAAESGNVFSRLLRNRMAGERTGGGRSDSEARSDRSDHGTAFWMQGIGTFGDVGGNETSGAYDYDIRGMAMGFDRAFGSTLRLGLAGGYSTTDLDQPSLGARGEIESWHVGAYGTVTLPNAFVDLQASYAGHDISSHRTLITGNTTSRTATGETSAEELRGSIRAGLDLGSDRFGIRPVVSLGYVRVDQDGLTETGAGDSGLIVQGNDYEALTGAIGVELDWTLPIAGGALRPFADLTLSHDFVQEGWVSQSRMIGGGRAFSILASEPGATAALANVGIAGNIGRAELRVSYGLELREELTSHAVTAGLTFRW